METFPRSMETPQKTEQQKVNSTCTVDSLSSLLNFSVETMYVIHTACY